jgi:GT2 family glycosyltransferase
MPPNFAPMPDVSVIICTRDRPAHLMNSLGALRRACEGCLDLSVEVLVVENGSDEGSMLDELAVAAIGPSNTRLCRLAAGNLSQARNFGMLNARGALLAFVDDDCLVDPQWLNDARQHWRALPPDFLAGGRVRLADSADLPFTIKDVDVAQKFTPDVHPGGFVQGCNFILPRGTAQRIGLFDPRFGAGARFRAGEDTDFIIRAHGLGIEVHYVPDMLVLHRHGRRSYDEILRLNCAYAYANGAILAKHLFNHRWLARHLLWTIRSTVRERKGGPSFDAATGLNWNAVTRAQLLGFANFVGSIIFRRERYL